MKLFTGSLFFVTIILGACTQTNKNNVMDLKNEAKATLNKVLQEQQEWVKVHAAEFLIWTGNAGAVKETYLKEQELFREKPQYRIGIWRVLAQVSTGEEATQYKKQILQAFLDTTGKDRIHAIETMAKLKMSLLPEHAVITKEALDGDIKSLSAYAHWAIAYTNEDSLIAAKKYFLASLLNVNEDMLSRRIAAYVLRNSGSLEPQEWENLKNSVLSLPDDADGKISFLNATLLTAPMEERNGADYQKMVNQLLAFSAKKDKGTRMEIAAGLAAIGIEEHLPVLKNWLNNSEPTGNASDDADVQASAAYAILKIVDRLGVSVNK